MLPKEPWLLPGTIDRCPALQTTAVPPLTLHFGKDEARTMLKCLFEMGVKPEALLLPRQPDPGKCKLCRALSLEALIDILMERCNGDLSPHKEVMGHTAALTSVCPVFS